MYETYFRLHKRPFRSIPDGDSYYPSSCHESALAQILQGLADEEGLISLVGAAGTGKTLLCHRIFEKVDPEINSALLTNTHFPDRKSLFQAIHYDLQLPFEGKSEQELRLSLTHFLLENFSGGRRTFLIVDEAQNLSSDLWEELRLLGNLEARSGKALQILLAGQPAVNETLQMPELTGLRQRMRLRIALNPLDRHEAADYLLHQIRMAGGRSEDMITDEAVEILCRGSAGLLRVLNQIAHQAFCLARGAECHVVDAEIALEAVEALSLSPSASEDQPEHESSTVKEGWNNVSVVRPAEKVLSLPGNTERQGSSQPITVSPFFEMPRKPA